MLVHLSLLGQQISQVLFAVTCRAHCQRQVAFFFLPAAVITGKEFFKFNLEYLLWLRPLHTAEKHRPTTFHTATCSCMVIISSGDKLIKSRLKALEFLFYFGPNQHIGDP